MVEKTLCHLAHDFALGGEAHALQANTAAARDFIWHAPFFYYAQFLIRYFVWVNLLVMTPLFVKWFKAVKRAKCVS